MPKIGGGKAISEAEDAFKAWYASAGVAAKVATFIATGDWKIGVKNDGTDDYVTPDVEKGVVDTWKGKGALNGFERRGSISSGEAKIDLKFAYPDRSESSFNYHVKVMQDPAIEEARKKQAAADKKVAEEFKKKQEAEKVLKEAAAKKQAEQDKIDAARNKKLSDAANKAWNDLGAKGQKGKTEKTWKADHMKNNKSIK